MKNKSLFLNLKRSKKNLNISNISKENLLRISRKQRKNIFFVKKYGF